MQLALYLYELKELGIEAKGELLFPEEKKRINVALTPELEQKIEQVKKYFTHCLLRIAPSTCERKVLSQLCLWKFCWA